MQSLRAEFLHEIPQFSIFIGVSIFRTVDKSSGYLFSSRELRDLIDARRSAMRQEVEGMNGNQFLNTSPVDLARYFLEKYSWPAPKLCRDAWSASEQEMQIDVRNDQNRRITDRSRPCLIPGQRIDIEVPVEGDIELFYARANTSSSMPPRAQIRASSLFLTYDIAHDAQQRDIKQEAERMLNEVEQHLGWLRSDLNAFNQNLQAQAEQAITDRRTRLLAHQGRVASLGIPLRSRTDAPKTYAIPEVRRKIVPLLPAATSAAFEPEPALNNENYEHILTVIQNMTHVMERSPTAFKAMGEEERSSPARGIVIFSRG